MSEASVASTTDFRTAVEAIDAGDAGRLSKLLAATPDLATMHAPKDFGDDDEGPFARGHYEGYFHRPTLLHHVAGNPVRRAMPANAAELARLLLDAGAEPDAPCGGGLTQPETAGGTTLGLVMSSAAAVESGQAAGLIDLLVERGAHAGIADGTLLWLALYHVVECRRQREAAEHLRRHHGAPVDLACAAGLGELGTVSGFYGKGGALDLGAASLWRARKRGAGRDDRGPRPGEILAEALAVAAANGRNEVVTYLLERGVPTDIWTTYGPFRITPLHCAAWAGWPETVRLFLDRGADATMREPTHGGTPLGWAEHCGHRETMNVFLERPDRLDVVDLLEHGPDDALRKRLDDLDPNLPLPHHPPGVLLRLAAWFGRTEAVRQLLARGADPKLAASDGKTALDAARERGHGEVAALLTATDGR